MINEMEEFLMCRNQNWYSLKQKELFDKINVGDVVFAKLPVDQKILKKMDKSHIYRPFLVVQKRDEDLIVFKMSSVKRKNVSLYDYYKLPGLFNNESKPSFVYLDDFMKLPIQNIISIKKHMNHNIIMKLEKRLILANKYGHQRPRFMIKTIPEKEDIIRCEDELYLVVANVKKGIFVHKLLQKLDGDYLPILEGQQQIYYLYYDTSFISYNHNFTYVDIVSHEELKRIELKSSMNKKKRNKYYFRYPIGYTFCLGMRNYLYLYHKGEYCYGVEFDEDGFYMRIDRLDNLEYMKPGKQLNKEDVWDIIRELVDLKKDFDGVLLKMLKGHR